MGNYKWHTKNELPDCPYVVVLFTSRHKDNKEVENFVPRREAKFCMLRENKIFSEFEYFAAKGVPGETSRCYISLNARDAKKVQKELIHLLIDEEVKFEHFDAKIAGIAARKENAAEKRWFFDFDSNEDSQLLEFVKDIQNEGGVLGAVYPTPHGKAVVVERGFDTRKLMEKWGEIVSLKRDDLICRKWVTK